MASAMGEENAEVGLILHFGTGEYECSICHRRFKTHNYRPVDLQSRTLWRWFSNRPNAERHLRSCRKKGL